ncbi:hypothetical protein Glove_365g13 [Diversispora epigaea]|uniref:Uncharacterized protein n=1 Tax=Diversispora epigaea TaxID=1348612 RepID=A0A397HAU7_9GLOM|nr:hypothetical protein Glove_365g13 [Diversispora epigaea]
MRIKDVLKADNFQEVHEAESEGHHELYMIMLQVSLMGFHLIIIDIDFVSEDWQKKSLSIIFGINLSIQKWRVLLTAD